MSVIGFALKMFLGKEMLLSCQSQELLGTEPIKQPPGIKTRVISVRVFSGIQQVFQNLGTGNGLE